METTAKSLKFNTFYDPSRESRMLTVPQSMTLDEVSALKYSHDDNYWPYIQMFASDHRVKDIDGNPAQWQDWTGCTYIDIDLKHVLDESERQGAQSMIDNVAGYIEQNTGNILYAWQLSKNNGFHFIFHFDVRQNERNSQIFTILAKKSQLCVSRTIERLYPELWQRITAWDSDPKNAQKKVIDDCSTRPAQIYKMTDKPLRYARKAAESGHGDFLRGIVPSVTLDLIDKGTEGLREAQLAEFMRRNNSLLPEENRTNGVNIDLSHWDASGAHWDGDYGNIGWGNLTCRWLVIVLEQCLERDKALDIFKDMFGGSRNPRKSSWGLIRREFEQNWGRSDNDPERVARSIYAFADRHLGIVRIEAGSATVIETATGLEGDSALTLTGEQRLDNMLAKHIEHPRPVVYYEADHVLALDKGEYIGNTYSEEIERLMQESGKDWLYLDAPCGSGKTKYIIQQFRRSKRAIIAVHLNSIKSSNYATQMRLEGLQFDCPDNGDLLGYLRDGNLPDKLLLGWPQLAILLSRSDSEDLKGYRLFLDEAHALQAELGYRFSDIEKIALHIGKVESLMMVSATPLAECNALMGDNALRISIEKEREYTIRTTVVHNETPQGKVEDTVAAFAKHALRQVEDEGLQETVKVAIYDNHSHEGYELLLHDEDYIHLYRDGSHEDGVVDALQRQVMSHDILISTAYGKEGLEYKNHVDTLMVLVPRYSDLTINDIEQFINRFRDKDRVEIYLFDVQHAKDRQDNDLARKVRILLSDEALRDEEMPGLIRDINNHYILESTKVDIEDAIRDRTRLSGVLDLVAAYYHNQQCNSIANIRNVERAWGTVYKAGADYHDDVVVKRAIPNEIKALYSVRENVVRDMGKVYRKDVIKALREYGLIGNGANLHGKGSDLERFEEWDKSFSVEALFGTGADMGVSGQSANQVGREEREEGREGREGLGGLGGAEIAARGGCGLSFEDKAMVKAAIRVLSKVRVVMNEVSKQPYADEDERNPEVMTDIKWAFSRLWSNRKGIINWEIAAKVAQLYPQEEGTAISMRQRAQVRKDFEWLYSVISTLYIDGKQMDMSLRWGCIDWRRVTRRGDVGERDRKGEKFCLVSDETVKFKSVDEMYEYAQTHFDCKMNNQTFKIKWKSKGWFRKI